ncbi:VOC family protein [Microbulbifer spongiae]|uniref:VOC family protein n=1 Tax=Microbulbifer spongiae TaxID=2944933 RepID=A0ABY9ECZ3_9GAMM|nr:VOC family protein [Microbulbifer sp. MI-G]WKD50320.1 VOC family protein [Microbulbifer sp. MI-G]
MGQILGLHTVIYGVTDIAEARAWYTQLLGQKPTVDSDGYVGFRVGDCELGLNPDARSAISRADGVIAYWAVEDVAAQVEHLGAMGARQHSDVVDVGKGVLMVSFLDPFGNIVGLVEQPQTQPEVSDQ